MFIYEFECPKGHITEQRVPMGTREFPCEACRLLGQEPPLAKRILSPTRTTFAFADKR